MRPDCLSRSTENVSEVEKSGQGKAPCPGGGRRNGLQVAPKCGPGNKNLPFHEIENRPGSFDGAEMDVEGVPDLFVRPALAFPDPGSAFKKTRARLCFADMTVPGPSASGCICFFGTSPSLSLLRGSCGAYTSKLLKSTGLYPASLTCRPTGKPGIHAYCSDFTSDSGQRSSRPWRSGSLAASAFLLPRGWGPLWDRVRCGGGCGGEWKFAAWGRVPQWA